MKLKSIVIALALLTSATVSQAQVVVNVGTGYDSASNPVFVGAVLRNLQGLLVHMGLPQSSVATLYGAPTHEEQSTEAVLEREQDGDYVSEYMAVPGVARNASFTHESLRQALAQSSSAPATLLTFVGHGSRDGVRGWGESATPLTAVELFAMLAPLSRSVIVSGTCFGGQYAQSASCGFFGARPDRYAAGCSASAAVLSPDAPIEDYVGLFFAAANDQTSDFDRDGIVSFQEAHYATVVRSSDNMSRVNVEYTTLDALADEYFTANGADLVASMTASEIATLGSYANLAESYALQDLLRRYGGSRRTSRSFVLKSMRLPFVTSSGATGIFEINPFGDRSQNYVRTVLDVRIVDSLAVGSATIPSEYTHYAQSTAGEPRGFRATISQIARRLIFKKILQERASDPALASWIARATSAQTCESQGVAAFLGASAPQ